ncbi:MAG: class I SAM-dependent methyltransferase [Firmicutes bacterium]|nr:class I SAM-dependent methyltransferase [Bacillota bacterium]
MEKLSLNMRSYNRISRQWKEFRDGCPVNRCIEEFAGLLKPGGRILDIGCGTGCPIDVYLTGLGLSVTGIDISVSMIRYARGLSLKDARFEVCTFPDYDCSEGFDGIVAFDSLWHIPLERQLESIAKAASLLCGGGYFIFTHGKNSGEVYGEMMDSRFYYSTPGRDGLISALADCGFSIIRAEEDYREATTGTRELLIIAQKERCPIKRSAP